MLTEEVRENWAIIEAEYETAKKKFTWDDMKTEFHKMVGTDVKKVTVADAVQQVITNTLKQGHHPISNM